MRGCWNFRIAVILFYFYLHVVRAGSGDSDVSTQQTFIDHQVIDLNQITSVPDTNIAPTSIENGHSPKVPTSTKQKRCNRDRVGVTLTARQNLPSDINLIPRRHDVTQIAKNLCIQCISLNKCKTAEGCRACSLICKDVVLLKDQDKDAETPTVECANPTAAQGDGEPVVETAASSGAGQEPTASEGPVVGSRAGFVDEQTCGGHLLATVTSGNVKEMLLQMVGVQDPSDIVSISVRAMTRSGAVPVAKGPEGPEALLTIFKDELTSAIEAEHSADEMVEPPTIHELFYKVLELVQNSKPEVNHIGVTHAEESSPQTPEKEEDHPLVQDRERSPVSQTVTGPQNARLESDLGSPTHKEGLSPIKIQEDNGDINLHLRTKEQVNEGLGDSNEKSDRVGSDHIEISSEADMQEKEEELNEDPLNGKSKLLFTTDTTAKVQNSESKTERVDATRQMQEEDEELHEEREEALAPQVENSGIDARLGSAHTEKSSPRQMQEDGDMLPRYPLAEEPEGFVVPQLANPAIIEGPPPPGMLLGANQKENKAMEFPDDIGNASPNNRHVEAVDSTEEDLPRYNLADHEGSLILQVSNISTIGLSSPTGNELDDSFIPDMEAEASKPKPASTTTKDQSKSIMTRSEAGGNKDLTKTGEAVGTPKEDARMTPGSSTKHALNANERDDTPGATLGAMPDVEPRDLTKESFGGMSVNKMDDFKVQNIRAGMSEGRPFSINKATPLPRSMIEDLSKDERIGSLNTQSSSIETIGKHSQSDLPVQKSKDLEKESFDAVGAPVMKNKIEESTLVDVATAMESGASQETSLTSVKENPALGAKEINNEEADASTKKSLSNIEEIATPKAKSDETSIHLKSSLPETMTGAAETQNKDSLSTKGQNSNMLGNMHSKHLEMGQPHFADTMEKDALGSVQSKEVGDAKKQSLGSTAEGHPSLQMEIPKINGIPPLEDTVAAAFGNEMEAKNLVSNNKKNESVNNVDDLKPMNLTEKSSGNLLSSKTSNRTVHIVPNESGRFGMTEKDLLSAQNVIGNSVVQDSDSGLPVTISQTTVSEKEPPSIFRGVSEAQTVPEPKIVADLVDKVTHSVVPGIENEASDALGSKAAADFIVEDETQVLSDSQMRTEVLRTSGLDLLGNGGEGARITGIQDGTSEMISPNSIRGPSIEPLPAEKMTIPQQGAESSGALKKFPQELPENVVGTALRKEGSTTNEFSENQLSDLQTSTITRTGAESPEKELSIPTVENIVGAELQGGNDMVAESSENKVMNVVVPDEFLGWSKPSDNPTTINIVIPPKAVPQESVNIEKEDLREAEPQDEPEERDEFGLEIIEDEEQVDNREADTDGDFETENQVRVSNDEENDDRNMDNRNRDFDEHQETDDDAPEEEQLVDDDAPNNINGNENEGETPETRYAETDDENDDEGQQSSRDNEERDDNTDKIGIAVERPNSFNRLKNLMGNMQNPQERIASMMKKAKDRSNVGARPPIVTEEVDSTFQKKFTRPESRIGKMLEKFRDRLHRNKVEDGTSAFSSSTHQKSANEEEDAGPEDDERLSNTKEKQHANQNFEHDSRLEERPDVREQSQDFAPREPNQEGERTTYKSSDFKGPLRNVATSGNGRISSDSQVKDTEDPALRTNESQNDKQQSILDPQNLKETHSQLQERMNVGNNFPFNFTPGEGLMLEEPDRELALSGVNQDSLLPTTRSTIFGEHFSSTPSLSEIISSAKDKFRKNFEEGTNTFNNRDKGNFKANPSFQEASGFDRLLGDSTSTSRILTGDTQNAPIESTGTTNSVPSKESGFQQDLGMGRTLGDGIRDNQIPMKNTQNSGLVVDGTKVGHTIHEIGRSTSRVIQDASDRLGDTISKSSAQASNPPGIENIFRDFGGTASRRNDQQLLNRNLGSSDQGNLGSTLPINDGTLSQSLNQNPVGYFDGIGQTVPKPSPLNNIGIPRFNLNRIGQIISGIPNQEGNRLGKLNSIGSLQPGEGSSGYTGLTLNPMNRKGSTGNLKPMKASETRGNDPTNVDNLQSELIVEPPGLDTSDSIEEELKPAQAGFPKQQENGVMKQNQPILTENIPTNSGFDVHTPFSITRNKANVPTANPISNFEAAKNALLKLQQLTGRLRKKDGNGSQGTASIGEQPSVTDVVKVLQEISREVISTAENVSKSRAKNLNPTDPSIVGSQVLENSWENLQPFIPRDSHPLPIPRPTFTRQHHLVGMTPSTTLKTPLQAPSVTPLTYYTTPSAAKVDNKIQVMEPKIGQFGNSKLFPSLTKTHQIFSTLTPRPDGEGLSVKSTTTSDDPASSGFTNDDTNHVGTIQSNVKQSIPFGIDKELPLSINNMLTPKPDEALDTRPMKTNDETVNVPSMDLDKPQQLPPISVDQSPLIMSPSSSDIVENMQPVTKNIQETINSQAEGSSPPILASRHQNSIVLSAETPKDIYFVGTDLKLPLQMVKKEGGEVHLSVDIDKLCSCKNNSNCTKNQSELNKDLVVGESSSNQLAVEGVGKVASEGFAKRNIPTRRSLRDVEDKYAVEWEIEEPEEAHSDVHVSPGTGGTGGEHRIEIEISDPVIIPSGNNEKASNIEIANRFSSSTDDVKLKDIKLTIGSPQMDEKGIAIRENASSKHLETERNAIKKSHEKVLNNKYYEQSVVSSEIPLDDKNDTSNSWTAENLSLKNRNNDIKISDQSNQKENQAQNLQYNNPFIRLSYPEVSSKNPLDSTESMASSTEKSTYLSNLLKKLRSRLPTQEPRTVSTNLKSPLVSNIFSHRMKKQEVESAQEPKSTKLSDRLRELNLDRYNNLATRNRLFPTFLRQKKPLDRLDETTDGEKDASSIGDENREKQGSGVMKNLFSWFKNLNKQKR